MYKLADAIRKFFYPNWPNSATMEGWAEWHKEAKKRKVAYWMSRKMPAWFRHKASKVRDVKLWFQYRFQNEHAYHLIDTKLGYGYHEIEERMLYGMFNLLVNFVEVEKAQLHYIGMDKDDVRPSPKFAGLQHLDWEIELVHDEDECIACGTPELINKPTSQAIAAFEIKYLYQWWVDIRPKRPDPWDNEKLSALYPHDDDMDIMEMLGTKNPKKDKLAKELREQAHEQEMKYQKQDDEMLMRLVEIRHALWA